MDAEHARGPAAAGPGTARAGALAIAGGAVLSVALMAHHPTVEASDVAGMLEELRREAVGTRRVHGGMVAGLAAMLVGFTELARVLGWGRFAVRAALVAHGLGALWLSGAALASGFVVPGLAWSHAAREGGDLEALRPVFAALWEANQALAAAGTVGLSAAIACWSLALVGRGGGARLLSGLGLAAGVLPAAGLLAGHLRLHVHGMAAVLVAQAVWSVAVAAWMLRRRG